MRIESCARWSECRSEDIATLPLFYVFMAAIKTACLDREITPCLPPNKPPAPLFIIHNLLWCQGQSDSIVTVKGISADPELSMGMGNPGIQTDNKKNPLKSDGLDCNQPKIFWKKWQCSQQSACRHFGNTLAHKHVQRNAPKTLKDSSLEAELLNYCDNNEGETVNTDGSTETIFF